MHDRPAKAVLILSGGQDSTTCLFWAIHKWPGQKIYCLTFDYGQRHDIEIFSAHKVVDIARSLGHDIEHDVIKIPPECLISMSPLTAKHVDLEQYENATQMEEVIANRREVTFVPMRNAMFLTIAANRAEANGSKYLITGVCQMDNANYDDCRAVFVNAAQDYINKALGHDHRGTGMITIRCPLLFLSKAETVKMARELPGCWEALAYTHTSYDGNYPPTDMNHANVLRADGFKKAGEPDPLVVRAYNEGLMELPATSNYDGVRKGS